ncbi:hypothetical protein [Acidianus sp. RZ1]|uniref:hypothetical protein n=1 Tax=Acidianus sp. RZ1 TaxID=1540082 RepID=UPI0014924576|nr:hypothetical protein [Acidianus sp. RZ1]NON62973.1 hypothetical protein [Acidianus sp. RZ1]
MELSNKAILSVLVAVVVFFIVLSLPMNYSVSSIIGVENATIVAAVVYILLASGAFLIIFKKVFA